jgi:hypothetical protein
MTNTKNRKVWGIEIPKPSSALSSPILNFGEGRYKSVTWNEFLACLPTFKIPFSGPRGGEQWRSIADSFEKKGLGMLNVGLGLSFLVKFFENTFIYIK